MYRLYVCIGALPYSFEVGSFAEPGADIFFLLSWQQANLSSPAVFTSMLGLEACVGSHSTCCVGAGSALQSLYVWAAGCLDC